MKKISLAFLLFLISFCSNAQIFTDDEMNTLSEIKYVLPEEDRAAIEAAEAKLKEADEIVESVAAEDAELEKYFKKGSNPKAEKKAINVKVKRVNAAVKQETAFNEMQEVLGARLKRLKFFFPQERKEAKELRNSSLIKAEQGIARGDDYKYLDDKDFGDFPYESLKSAIDEANGLFKESITDLMEAYGYYLDQDRKREEMGEDEYQWTVATYKNNYKSYDKYLEKVPGGVHTEEAHTRMKQINPEKYAVEKAGAVAASSASDVASDAVASNGTNETVAAATTTTRTVTETRKSNAPANDVFAVNNVSTTTTVEEKVETKTSTTKVDKARPVAKKSTPVASASSAPGVVYRLQFIAVSRQISIEEAKEVSTSNLDVVEFQEGGLYKYAMGGFSTYVEAKDYKNTLGIQCFVVGFKDGQKVSLSTLLGY